MSAISWPRRARRWPAGAACLRINPGNIGSEERVREVIKAARDHDCSIRIGVNAGSLEKNLLEKYGEPCPEAMVESGLAFMREILVEGGAVRGVKTDRGSYAAPVVVTMPWCTRQDMEQIAEMVGRPRRHEDTKKNFLTG